MRKRGIFVAAASVLCIVAGSHGASLCASKLEEPLESKAYGVGDLILADGSVIGPDKLTTVDDDHLPVAVVAGFQEDGRALGLGVHRSSSPLPWAVEGSTGYTTRFTDLRCTQETDLSFAGDKDGSDNWEVICAQDEAGTREAQENYPAFFFAHTYGETYHLTKEYASGWYLPSIEELNCVYENREAINGSLEKIYQLDNDAAMDSLGTNWYWSSSQADAEDDYAWFIHYFNGYAGECPKNFTNLHVLAIRTL